MKYGGVEYRGKEGARSQTQIGTFDGAMFLGEVIRNGDSAMSSPSSRRCAAAACLVGMPRLAAASTTPCVSLPRRCICAWGKRLDSKVLVEERNGSVLESSDSYTGSDG
jgi:hypothetical protein